MQQHHRKDVGGITIPPRVPEQCGDKTAQSPRFEMAMRLPGWLQPLLTFLTAMPAPSEPSRPKTTASVLLDALMRLAFGITASCYGLATGGVAALIACFIGLVLTTSAMGVFQVVIFHYCAHSTVFPKVRTNVMVGRAISIVFLFTFFDSYKADHLQHHRANVLLTDRDEFAGFLFNLLQLQPGLPKSVLWQKAGLSMLSPLFHARFLVRRLTTTFHPQHPVYNLLCAFYWMVLLGVAWSLGLITELLIAWILPLIMPLQVATVLRTLCEHRFPTPILTSKRGKGFVCEATTGVFPGRHLPIEAATSCRGLCQWALWWLDALFIQLFVRLFVLVGDAPCHDFHHRHPGSRSWPAATFARQHDRDAGCPGYPFDYRDVWGLWRAVDANLDTLSSYRAASPILETAHQ